MLYAPYSPGDPTSYSVNGSEPHPNGVYAVSKSQKYNLSNLYLFFSGRCNKQSSTLDGISQNAPDHWSSVKFTEVAGPYIFIISSVMYASYQEHYFFCTRHNLMLSSIQGTNRMMFYNMV